VRFVNPIEEIIILVATRRKVSIDEIEQVFKLPNNSTKSIIDFLVNFDFVRVVDGRFLALSETSTPFFDEIVSRH
jgi:hypothetical protein